MTYTQLLHLITPQETELLKNASWPLYKREKKLEATVIPPWLVGPPVTETKAGPTSDCEMRIAADFFLFLKWQMTK